MAERLIRLHLERRPEGVSLVTSDDLPGLLAQGCSIAETIGVAQDAARRLIESHIEHGDPLPEGLSADLPPKFELSIPVAA